MGTTKGAPRAMATVCTCRNRKLGSKKRHDKDCPQKKSRPAKEGSLPKQLWAASIEEFRHFLAAQKKSWRARRAAEPDSALAQQAEPKTSRRKKRKSADKESDVEELDKETLERVRPVIEALKQAWPSSRNMRQRVLNELSGPDVAANQAEAAMRKRDAVADGDPGARKALCEIVLAAPFGECRAIVDQLHEAEIQGSVLTQLYYHGDRNAPDFIEFLGDLDEFLLEVGDPCDTCCECEVSLEGRVLLPCDTPDCDNVVGLCCSGALDYYEPALCSDCHFDAEMCENGDFDPKTDRFTHLRSDDALIDDEEEGAAEEVNEKSARALAQREAAEAEIAVGSAENPGEAMKVKLDKERIQAGGASEMGRVNVTEQLYELFCHNMTEEEKAAYRKCDEERATEQCVSEDEAAPLGDSTETDSDGLAHRLLRHQ